MKRVHIPFYAAILILLGSCSTAYRTGQTPDDVYYSPAPAPQEVYVRTENQKDRDSYNYRNSVDDEDLAIRRGIYNSRFRSNVYVTFGAGSPYYGMGYSPYSYYNPYSYSSPYSFGNPYAYKYGYSPYSAFDYYDPYAFNSFYYDSYYNPYYSGLNLSPYSYVNYGYYPRVYYTNTNTRPVVRGARMYNLRPYNNANGVRSDNVTRGTAASPSSSGSAPVRRTTVAPSNNNRGVGNTIRRVFTPSDNSNSRVNRSYPSENTRSYDNSIYSPTRSSSSSSGSSSSSSSGSSGGGSAPVRTFRR